MASEPTVTCPAPNAIPASLPNETFQGAGVLPVSAAVYPNADSLPALSLMKSISIEEMEAKKRDLYFGQGKAVLQKYGSQSGYSAPGGIESPGIFSFITDSPTVQIIGTQGGFNGGVTVVVDGKVWDKSDLFIPVTTGVMSAVQINFPGRRFRKVEVISKFAVKSVRVDAANTCGMIWPYQREGKQVAIMGDSWVDGTTQAPASIGNLLVAHPGFHTAVSATGGTGYLTANGGWKSFTDPDRIKKIAANKPEVAVIFGSINDEQDEAALKEAGQAIIDGIRELSPKTKIILTGPQFAVPKDAMSKVAKDLASSNKDVFYEELKAFVTEKMRGPKDMSHPSVSGARDVADWVAGKIKAHLS